LEVNNDFWGDGVNVAARLAGLAKAGEIYTSAATLKALPPEAQAMTRDLSALSVKGKQEELQVYQVLWDESETEDATQLAHAATGMRVQATLLMRMGGRDYSISAGRNDLVMGREKDCDVVVAEKTASRRHARIERRGLQYYVVDEST